jgi:hypothetical protein
VPPVRVDPHGVAQEVESVEDHEMILVVLYGIARGFATIDTVGSGGAPTVIFTLPVALPDTPVQLITYDVFCISAGVVYVPPVRVDPHGVVQEVESVEDHVRVVVPL